MEFDKMEFDREKVLTPFTAHKAKKGDIGWIGIEPKDIYHNARFRRGLVELTYVNYNLMRVGEDWSFYSKEGDGYYFYPAPYEYLQKKWVEENNLKVGDKVKVVRLWEVGERGFRETVGDIKVGHIRTVEGFSDGCIQVRKGSFTARYPYFAIEKIKDEYRPFKDAEEFKDYREEWWEIDNIRQKAIFYGNRGVWFDGDFFEYETFFNDFRHADTGNPAGIKL